MRQENYYLIMNGMIVGKDGNLATLVKSFNDYVSNGISSAYQIDFSKMTENVEHFKPINYQTAFTSISKKVTTKRTLLCPVL